MVDIAQYRARVGGFTGHRLTWKPGAHTRHRYNSQVGLRLLPAILACTLCIHNLVCMSLFMYNLVWPDPLGMPGPAGTTPSGSFRPDLSSGLERVAISNLLPPGLLRPMPLLALHFPWSQILLSGDVEENPGPGTTPHLVDHPTTSECLRDQKTLRLMNPRGKLCYANAGTNFLLAAPDITKLLSQLPQGRSKSDKPVTTIMHQLTMTKSLTALRDRLVDNMPAAHAFRDTERHQDGQEWVDLLVEAIGKELPPDQKEQWVGLFYLGIEELFKCSAGHHQPKRLAHLSTLQLSILDEETGQPLITLDAALANYFADERIEKNCSCAGCGAKEATKESRISFHPNLLKIQYKRFQGTNKNKIGHPVSGNTVLKFNDTRYELVSLLQHMGEDGRNGHYISVTRCVNTGRSFRNDDNMRREEIDEEQLQTAIANSYMLMYRRLHPVDAIMECVIEQQLEEPRSREEEPTSQQPYAQESSSEVATLMALVEEKATILSIRLANRTKPQNNRQRWLTKKIKDMKDKFPHINVNRKVKSDEEKRVANRARLATDENKKATRVRMATDKNKEADRTRKTTDRARTADRYRKVASRARGTLKLKDGLQNDLVMQGHFKVPRHNLGEKDKVCQYCGARHYEKETGARLCCMAGKVVLPRFTKPSDPFLQLWFKSDIEGITFRKFSRSFNNGLCLASLRVQERRFSGFTPSIIFEGRVHQFLGPLQAEEGEQPRFAQLYVHDPGMETTERIANMRMPGKLTVQQSQAVERIVESLQAELKAINPFVKDFLQIMEQQQGTEGRLVISAKAPLGEHARRYNPQVSLGEVSILTNSERHDLIINRRGGGLQIISHLNPNGMPLHFTVLFPYGDHGWHEGMKQVASNKRLTAREFAIYHLAVRDEKQLTYEEAVQRKEVDFIHLGGRVLQEWCLMKWKKVEDSRLTWQELNQKTLRADTYKNVKKAVNIQQMALAPVGDALYPDDNQGNHRVGTKILSSTFVWYHRQFMDAMAIVREHGKQEFFITMTCNPRWPEIMAELRPDQNPEDRPDVTTTVFKLKYDSLMNDLTKSNIFGKVKGYLAMVEFQKRGLPHAHILLISTPDDRLRTAEQVDSVICAELPLDPETAKTDEDKEQMRQLQDDVATNMIHGPCGAANPQSPCMVDGKCSKGYPKVYQKETLIDPVSGAATYRRRAPEESGRTLIIKRGGREYEVDNRWVVPYNPLLLLRYGCHINVEKATSSGSAKYLYKYVTKGADRAMVSTVVDGGEQPPRDEISEYRDLQSVGSCAAVWHMKSYLIAQHYPSVQVAKSSVSPIVIIAQVLRVHDYECQHVTFGEGKEEESMEKQRETELTKFFNMNDNNKKKGLPDKKLPTLRYSDMPKEYVWNKNKTWTKRKKKSSTIGRVNSIHPSAGEAFFLRALLHSDHCKGKTSHDDLKTVLGEKCDTYKEACQKLGMLQDDKEWEMALEDAAHVGSCKNQLGLFVTIALWCNPANPRALFDEFWLYWTDSIVGKARDQGTELCNIRVEEGDPEDVMARKRADQAKLKTLVLLELKQLLFFSDRTLADIHLPEPTEEELAAVVAITEGRSAMVRDELDFNSEVVRCRAADKKTNFTDEQHAIFNTVLEAVKSQTPKAVFIQAVGGGGKTFLLNGLLDEVRGLETGGCVALATATTGKAAMHLHKGRTFHSRFKAPVPVRDDSRLRVPAQSELAKLIRMARLIVVDEATMLDNRLLLALDECLRDIIETPVVFGGKVVVFSGDFRQTLPVVQGASRAGIVAKCLNQHALWRHFEVLKLTQNMRVKARGDQRLMKWDKWLSRVGDGLDGEVIPLPEERCMLIKENTAKKPRAEEDSLEQLINIIFPNLSTNMGSSSWLEGRAILTPLNRDVDLINDAMVMRTPGQEVVLRSADSVADNQDARSFSVEYCNSLNPTGLPKHQIIVKEGTPVMLLRNLDPSSGLCNGTKMIFKRMSPNNKVMLCDVKDETTGKSFTYAVPRIALGPKDREYSFEWSRRQYPVRVAYATTINKAQGDTLKMAGIWLNLPVFGHGQLYVALSRVGAPEKCMLAIKPPKSEEPYTTTRNVVFHEVLETVSQATEEEEEQEVVTTRVEVPDITEWLDYDAIASEFDTEMELEEVLEEAEPDRREEIERRVQARKRPQLKRLSRPTPKGTVIPDTSIPEQLSPKQASHCDYDKIQENNIAECEEEFLRIFGRPLNKSKAISLGLLEEEEDELSELEENDEE